MIDPIHIENPFAVIAVSWFFGSGVGFYLGLLPSLVRKLLK